MGECRGGVVKSTKWEAGLAPSRAWVGVRRVEGSSSRAQVCVMSFTRPVTFGSEHP